MEKDIIEKIKELKKELDVPIGLCKEALEYSNGDLEKAKEYLRKKGAMLLQKKENEEVGQGIIEGYVHFNGRVGALVELRCQTDFVARSEEFKKLAHEIAVQVATMNPLYVSPDKIPSEIIKEKTEEFLEEIKNKPKEIQEKVINGKLEKWYSEICLLEQPYFKDESIKVKDLIFEVANKFGEKIEVRRFVRLMLNE